jgi:glycosyltransferase involved in cell wall biosynthesis
MSSWDLCLYLTDEHEESFGLAVAECMVLGVPIICQNKGALSEVVGDGGVVCDTMYQVLESCKRFIKDHEFRKELSTRAKEKSKEYKRIEIVKSYSKNLQFSQEIL